MTLKELSGQYRRSAEPIRARIRLLRQASRRAGTEDERQRLQHRLLRLTQMLTQLNELAELTEHYYERTYYRDEKYRL